MKSFREFGDTRILLFDGAMGTAIQGIEIDGDVWGECNGNNETLNLKAPHIINEIHMKYFAAGADVAITNTFGANRIVLAEYGLQNQVKAINTAAVKIARQAADSFKDKYVALSVGPGSKLPTLGQISYDELFNAYYEQVYAGAEEGIDCILIETCQDLLQIKAALNAAFAVCRALEEDIPVMVSFTVEENGQLLVGTDIACVATVLDSFDIYALGLNCGFGPDKMYKPLARLAEMWNGKLYLASNAGIPEFVNGKSCYPLSADDFAGQTSFLIDQFGLSAVGGCCGTNFDHIKALNTALQFIDPVMKGPRHKQWAGYLASSYQQIPLRQEPAPALVGERANATGSRVFRDYLKAEDYEGVVSVARVQEAASHIIDISVAYSGRSEGLDMGRVVPMLNRELIQPLMIDSTSPEVILNSLKAVTGKPVINSVNLEDGGHKMRQIFDMVGEHPAAVVALTIDEQGMAQTCDAKLKAARRIYEEWTTAYGYAPQDLIIDFLTFAVTSGDEDSRFAAVETLKAVKMFKAEFPAVNTLLGVSNISYGLSPTARIILNSVFLSEAVKAGLDMAIVHAEKLLPLNKISQEEIALSLALLNGEKGALDRFVEYFESRPVEEVSGDLSEMPVDIQLYQKVLRGDNTDLLPLIEALLEESSPMDVLNNILLVAMGEVGSQFAEGRMLLPFVLKSAEVMRAASDILSPYLKNTGGVERGTLVLATVKGDVHDIGKNLVDIIFSGNGYKVINMGTKIEGSEIVKAALRYNADAIGMSALLVKSVEIMKDNLYLIKEAGLDCKVLLGGAALSPEYVDKECKPILPGKVFYCKDAFAGISAMDPDATASDATENMLMDQLDLFRNWNISTFEGEVIPGFFGPRIIEGIKIKDLLPWLRKISLFEGKWGYRRTDNPVEDLIGQEEYENMLTEGLKAIEEFLTKKYKGKSRPQAVYGFYPVVIDRNELLVKELPETTVWKHFAWFPQGEKGECVSQLYKTSVGESVLPLQAVTLGEWTKEFLSQYYNKGDYVLYYRYHGLLAELTEALAEYTQERVRENMALKTGNTQSIPKKLVRYSFGYPLCPDLEGNIILCDILKAGKVGIHVNDNAQLEPVYSTCAFLAWHPRARY